MSKVDEAIETLKKSLGIGEKTSAQKQEEAEKFLSDAKAAQAAFKTPPADPSSGFDQAHINAKLKEQKEALEAEFTNKLKGMTSKGTPPPADPPADPPSGFDQAHIDAKLKEQKEALEAEFTNKLKGMTSKGTPPPAIPPATPPEQKEGVNMKDWNERLKEINKRATYFN